MPSKTITILLIIDDASMGGGQQHLLWLAERLDKATYSVHVACEEKGYLVDELRKRQIPVHSLQLTNCPSIAALQHAIALVRTLQPDVVHTHGGTAGLYGRVAARMCGKAKIVHTYHGIHYLHLRNPIKRMFFHIIEKRLVKITDCIICVAQGDYMLALNKGLLEKSKAEIIYNGIDITKYSLFSTTRTGNRKRKMVIGTIGRLHEQKGQIYLLQAMAELVKQFPDIELRIIGDGELRGALQTEAEKLGLHALVKFYGTRTDIPVQLTQFDVFVLSSLWEGLPLVILEAMAAGLPIVATNIDGTPELVRDGIEALLVPARDPVALQDAILRILHDNKMAIQLQERAAERVKAMFDVDVMVKKTESIYLRVLDRP